MPRQKISTLLDEHLFRRAKLEAVRSGRQLSQVLGQALEQYLAKAPDRPSTGVAAGSWGVLKLDPGRVTRLLRDEGGLLDD